jgi:protein kinase-like protein
LSLAPGRCLGVYEITAQIGEGGMGQVFRGTDTRLKRQVAIKILPPSLAGDADRFTRFQREAEVLASLNHPHIAGIYGLEESNVLPGGKGVLYAEHSSQTGWDTATLVVAPLSGGTPKIVVRGGYYGRYVPSGHLIYLQQGTLFAVRFDLTRLETIGQAVPALDGVAANPGVTGGAQLACLRRARSSTPPGRPRRSPIPSTG